MIRYRDESVKEQKFMSKWRLTGFVWIAFVPWHPLTAQSDPLLDCRKQAAIMTSVDISNVTAQFRGAVDNGNQIIWWDSRLASGHIASGFCEASAANGKI